MSSDANPPLRPTRESPNAAATTEDFEFEALSEARNYRRLLLEEFTPSLTGDVLEVGAGVGQFTAGLTTVPAVRSVTALEPDPKFVTGFRRRLANVPVINGCTADLPRESAFDAIVCINVLEHIREDGEELARHFQLLRARQGRLCLLVPAGPEIFAPIDKHFGHFRRYARPDLRKLLEDAGFTIEVLRYFNWFGYFAWWFGFRVMKRETFVASRVRLFDRWIFPPVNWLERRIVPPPLGQSLFAVARASDKPAQKKPRA